MILIELGDKEKKSIDELRSSMNYLSVVLNDRMNLGTLQRRMRDDEQVETYIQMLQTLQLVRQLSVDGVLDEMKSPENAISCIRFVDYMDDCIVNSESNDQLTWWNTTIGDKYIRKLDTEWESLPYLELYSGFKLFVGGLKDTAQAIFNLFWDIKQGDLKVNSYTISFQKFLNSLWWWTKIWTKWAESDMSLKNVPELGDFYKWCSVNLPSQSS